MVFKSVNLGAAFLLELCMLAALAYWGFHTGESLLLKIVLSIAAPLLAGVIWGLFLAPRSLKRLTGLPYLLLKWVIFGAAAIGLVAAGQILPAVAFVVVALINQILLIVWNQGTLQQPGVE